MMKVFVLMIFLFGGSAPAVSQITVITESAYHIAPAYGGRYKVLFAVIVVNPFVDKFASVPKVRVTARSGNGSILATQEFSSGGIPPRGIIAFCKEMYVDEMPVQVEIRGLSPSYEPTPFKPNQFLPFEVFNLSSRRGIGDSVRVTGEIRNPYPGETGVWITLLYRDKNKKLLGGHTAYESSIAEGEPTPFEFHINSNEIPPNMATIEKHVFSHNNYQSSWHKLLSR